MSFTTPTPPRTDEIPAAVAALIDVASTQGMLGGTGQVVSGNAADLPQLTRSKFGRVVVMPQTGPFATALEHRDRVRSMVLNVRVDFLRFDDDLDPDRFLGKLHAHLFALLEGQGPSLTYASVLHPLRRMQPPTSAREDGTAPKVFFSRSLYKIIVGSV